MEARETVEFRYFTLELGRDKEGGRPTVLCEWRGEDHLNLGEGPPPQRDEFAQAIRAQLGPASKSR